MTAADVEKRTAAEKASKAQLAATTAIDDLRWLMGDVRGRRFVWRLLERSGIYQSSFTGDALSMAFNEGRRNEGLRLLDEITTHCPKRLSEMQTESMKHERRNASSSTQ